MFTAFGAKTGYFCKKRAFSHFLGDKFGAISPVNSAACETNSDHHGVFLRIVGYASSGRYWVARYITQHHHGGEGAERRAERAVISREGETGKAGMLGHLSLTWHTHPEPTLPRQLSTTEIIKNRQKQASEQKSKASHKQVISKSESEAKRSGQFIRSKRTLSIQ